MPESNKPFSICMDDFNLEVGPYGATMTVKTTMSMSTPEVHGCIRMSVEEMKLLAFRMYQLVRQVEKEQAVDYPLSAKTLNALRIKEEDWTIFWKG